MKRKVFILLVSFFALATATAQEIKWMTLEEAIALQKKTPKKIMMDVYTAWCGPCKMLDKNTFHNKDVVEYVNKNYYAVKFNAEGNDVINYMGNSFSNPGYDPAKAARRNSVHQLTSYLKVQAYPTVVFMDEKANVIAPIVGYITSQQLELYLKLFKDDAHKNMDTQEKFNAYYESFKPEFAN
ncbi:MAG: thioredoxin fold domain-containing protein [Mangrovimonas sp.]|nr:thioredoxin fold domain-containing protein [Mangrovimonas sp.]